MAYLWFLKTEYDVIFRNTRTHEIIGNATFGIVSLNPYFFINKLNVDETSMHSLGPMPPERDEGIPVPFSIEKWDTLKRTIRIRDLCIGK